MSPYLLTVAFLMLMSLLTSSEIVRFSHHASESTFFNQSILAKAEMQEIRALSRVDDYVVHEPETQKRKKETQSNEPKPDKPQGSRKSASLAFNLDRPPNNSRLNFYFILNEELLFQGSPKEFTLKEVTARLMHSLYKDASFYYEGCEYKILDAIFAKKENTKNFNSPDDLSSLIFEDEKLQYIFYLMLKGHDGYPPLLNYITYDPEYTPKSQKKKINFLFADPAILSAVFPNHPDLVQKLIETREKFWEKVIDQEDHRLEREGKGKNRKDFKKEISESFNALISAAGLKGDEYEMVFDLSLGKYGNILFVRDPLSGLVKREKVYKIPPKNKTKPPETN